ncbi:MAG TPA: SDR family oxidoreductase, partial [Verrucomicrobiaceae bacterium]
PGAILIERTKLEAPDYEEAWGKAAPLGRVGLPEDIGHAVVFLASAEASFITGQTIFADGGAFLKPNWPYKTEES